MALTPQNIAAAVAARPENLRGPSSRLTDGKGAFKTMLTSQFGASKSILGDKLKDPMSPLADDRNNFANMLSNQVAAAGPKAAGSPPLAAPAAPSMHRTAIGQGVKQAPQAPAPAPAQASGKAPAQAPAQAAPSQQPREVKVAIERQEVRTPINPNARHPDDVGHLPGAGGKGPLPKGFTREEEDLLQAAAAAESKFLAAKRRASSAKADDGQGKADKMGILSAMYESRGAIDAIGYDGRGGTSYGKYQIASGVGTMDRFLNYLENKAPDLASRLDTSGPANTGGRQGGMTGEWKRIASEQPKRFETLQHEFIRDTHYVPALKSITMSTGQDMSTRSQAVREVLWSTAVQHGPNGASEIFSQALDKLEANKQLASDKALIEEVYAQRMVQFAGRGKLRVAVSTRLADEKESALSMLGGAKLG
ncbi:chitosanase [Fundidesulfovibrio soli]|uniref:VgrG-related protein n=1 Tax=Fundidesulfovibrio soli TaxID=2922716 RepID=UPI001FAFC0CA|nr:chitosanase [Fundidesulfovibrio soli]